MDALFESIGIDSVEVVSDEYGHTHTELQRNMDVPAVTMRPKGRTSYDESRLSLFTGTQTRPAKRGDEVAADPFDVDLVYTPSDLKARHAVSGHLHVNRDGTQHAAVHGRMQDRGTLYDGYNVKDRSAHFLVQGAAQHRGLLGPSVAPAQRKGDRGAAAPGLIAALRKGPHNRSSSDGSNRRSVVDARAARTRSLPMGPERVQEDKPRLAPGADGASGLTRPAARSSAARTHPERIGPMASAPGHRYAAGSAAGVSEVGSSRAAVRPSTGAGAVASAGISAAPSRRVGLLDAEASARRAGAPLGARGRSGEVSHAHRQRTIDVAGATKAGTRAQPDGAPIAQGALAADGQARRAAGLHAVAAASRGAASRRAASHPIEIGVGALRATLSAAASTAATLMGAVHLGRDTAQRSRAPVRVIGTGTAAARTAQGAVHLGADQSVQPRALRNRTEGRAAARSSARARDGGTDSTFLATEAAAMPTAAGMSAPAARSGLAHGLRTPTTAGVPLTRRGQSAFALAVAKALRLGRHDAHTTTGSILRSLPFAGTLASIAHAPSERSPPRGAANPLDETELRRGRKSEGHTTARSAAGLGAANRRDGNDALQNFAPNARGPEVTSRAEQPDVAARKELAGAYTRTPPPVYDTHAARSGLEQSDSRRGLLAAPDPRA